MIINKFTALFPLKGKITKTTLKANVGDFHNCVGAKVFKKALGNKASILEECKSWAWLNSEGVENIENTRITITTKEEIRFMNTKTPQSVTFVIKK